MVTPARGLSILWGVETWWSTGQNWPRVNPWLAWHADDALWHDAAGYTADTVIVLPVSADL